MSSLMTAQPPWHFTSHTDLFVWTRDREWSDICSYFPVTYAAGARVHSDSWGSNAVHYDTDAMAVDAFSHKHQDFISVFSAGNFGTLQGSYDTTVNSPALAKNTLAAGNARPSGLSYGLPQAPAGFVGQLQFAVGGVQAASVTFVAAEFSADWSNVAGGAGMPVAAADPIEVSVP